MGVNYSQVLKPTKLIGLNKDFVTVLKSIRPFMDQ